MIFLVLRHSATLGNGGRLLNKCHGLSKESEVLRDFVLCHLLITLLYAEKMNVIQLLNQLLCTKA